MEGSQKLDKYRSAKPQEDPPRRPEAYEGESFTEEDILYFGKLLADGKSITVASFSGPKHKLYEGGAKKEIESTSKRITKIYKRANLEGTDTAKISMDAVVRKLARDEIRSSPKTKGKIDALKAEGFKKQRKAHKENQGTLSVDTDSLAERAEELTAVLGAGTDTKEEAIAGYEQLKKIQSVLPEEVRTRSRISELESQLNSENVIDTGSRLITSEIEYLKKKLAGNKKEKVPVDKVVDSPEVSSEDTEPVAEMTHAEQEQKLHALVDSYTPESLQPSTDNEVLELTEAQIVPNEGGDNEAVAKKTPVSENREKFDELTQRLKKQADVTKEQGGVLELTQEHKQQFKEVAPAEREEMTKAEQEYLTAFKEFQSNKKVWQIIEPKALRELEQKYNETRVAYAKALDTSVTKRLEDKLHGDGPKMMNVLNKRFDPEAIFSKRARPGSEEVYMDKVRERYNRRFRFNEVIKPAVEKKLEAKMEALSSKEKGIAGKALEWFQNKNKEYESYFVDQYGEKKGKNIAKGLRAAGTALTLSAGLSIAGIAGVGTVTAFAGFASLRVGRSLFSAFAGGALGAHAGMAYEKLLGRKQMESAGKKLKNATGEQERHLDVETLSRMDKERANLTKKSSEANLQKNKVIIQLLTAFGVGAGTAEALSSWPSLHDAVTSTGHPHVTTTYEYHDAKGNIISESGTPKGAPGLSPTQPLGATHTTEPLHVGNGEGANQLFQDLKAQYPNLDNYPPNLKGLLSSNPADIAKHLGFGKENGGITLHPNDTLTANEDGRLIYHDSLHNKDFVVANKDGISDQWSSKIHKLQEASAKVVHNNATHTEAHRSTSIHEKTSHTRARVHTNVFDTQKDHEDVIRANKAEYEREFGPSTSDKGNAPIAQPVPIPEPGHAKPHAPQGVPEERPSPDTTHPQSHPDQTPVPEPALTPRPAASPERFTQSINLEGYDKIALPYVDAKGDIFVYGGPSVSPHDVETMALSHAQANHGKLVRFTVPKHGFLGSIKQHVEGLIVKDDGTVQRVRSLPDGKPFPPIDKTKFVGISRDQ